MVRCHLAYKPVKSLEMDRDFARAMKCARTPSANVTDCLTEIETVRCLRTRDENMMLINTADISISPKLAHTVYTLNVETRHLFIIILGESGCDFFKFCQLRRWDEPLSTHSDLRRPSAQ